MPRRSAEDARRTHAAIVDRAVDVASVEGLEGVTIGRLARDLRMSKSGVLGHFGTKEELQRAALEEAAAIFTREVWEPAAGAAPGVPRLLAICDAWISYLERGVFPGGCFLTAASCEFDGRPGPVRDLTAATMRRWLRVLAAEARTAAAAGEIPEDREADQVAFQLNALAMGLNQALQLWGDRRAPERARRAMREALGLYATS